MSPKPNNKAGAPAKKSSNGAAKKPAAPDAESIVAGSHADYEAFVPAAQALAEAEVVPMRADLQLALLNVQASVPTVLAEKARLAKLPETNVAELSSLPRLLLATIYADTQIDRSVPASDLQRHLARASELRALLLKTAESLAEAGLLSKPVVAAIRAGHGKLDTARDCIALAALFTKNAAALRGKHPIAAAQIKEAAEVGTALVQILKTKRARRAPAASLPAADMRDRLWTLVLRRYDALWRAGAYLFGRDQADAKVLPLQANRGGRPKKAPPQPAPPKVKAADGTAKRILDAPAPAASNAAPKAP